MTLDLQTQAVRNNAIWCDTIFRSHGRPGEYRAAIWLNRQPAPPYYPNAVTLTPDGQVAQLAAIYELAQQLRGEFGIKDSFFNLDLTPLGAHVLFEATWIYRPIDLPTPVSDAVDMRWRHITTPFALAEWEQAWHGDNDDPAPKRIFLPPLLADPNVAILAAYREQRIIAGVIANRTGQVVGLSNLFAPVGEEEACWARAVAGVIDAFPGLPLVGYERGDSLAQAQLVGFTSIGPLRIWLKGVESK